MPKRKRHRHGPTGGTTLVAPSALWHIEDPDHLPMLVEEIFSTSRYLPLIVVTPASDTARPRVDVEALVAAVGEHANVATLSADRSIGWTLSDLLPDDLRVYGGATRLFLPNAATNDSTTQHPLFLTDTNNASPETVEHIVRALVRSGYMEAAPSPTAEAPWQKPTGKAPDDPAMEVRAQLAVANSKIADLVAENASLRKQVHGLSDQVAELEERLHSRRAHTDPAEQLAHEIHLSWLHTYTEADRENHPLAPYSFGAAFVESVETIPGIDRERIVTACVDVLTRRAWEINGRQARQMRVKSDPGSPVRVRVHDGATAWRCNLQTNAASARRLMWWEIPGGAIELALVALHDDVAVT